MFDFTQHPDKESGKRSEDELNRLEQVEELRPALQKFLELKVNSNAIAMDLTQDTFEKYLSIEDSSKIKNIRSYLFTVAANLAKDNNRRERIYVVNADKNEQQPEPETGEPGPEEWLLYSDMQDKFKDTLQSLPRKCREVFYLRRIENLSSREIAEKFGISQRMVQKHLIKAIKHFHKHL
ncbi:MAG: hypothetical protein CMP91_07615 [Gammaproteobacteria bacterium]|nr:hypothetical protein [Gammaproteobacteria bacterium]|tara:strand:+ start:146079 stop:146618 length:540 start_codon:yes stop_codon:yes gene_type:complete